MRFHEILLQTDDENFSFLSLWTNKFYSWKLWFQPRVNWLQYQNKPALFTDLILSDSFGIAVYEFSSYYLCGIIFAVNSVFRSLSIFTAPMRMKLPKFVLAVQSPSCECWNERKIKLCPVHVIWTGRQVSKLVLND